jgi:outer membrane lipoprotein-sorting protein
MRKFLLIVILVLLSIKIACCEEPDAKKIIENIYMSSTLGKIQDMMIDADIFGPASGNQEAKKTMELIANAKVFFSAPAMIRTERTIIIPNSPSDEYVITIRDGRMAWIFTPYVSTAIQRKDDDHHHSYYLPFGIDYQPQDQYRNYTYIDQEKVGDRDAYIISITNEKDPEAKITTVWVDKERFIPLKEEYTITETKDNETKETKKCTLYKEPKQLPDKRWMPFKIERYENNKMTVYMTLKQVLVNQGLPLNLFNPEYPSTAPAP